VPWLLDLLVALGVLLLGFGTWQVQRLQWKNELIGTRAAQLAAEPVVLPLAAADWRAFDFRRVEITGTFRHDREQLFGIGKYGTALGRQLLTPLVRDDGAAVLVDRGWIPEDRTHPAARREGEVQGEVTIRGIARYRADDRPGWMTPDNQPGQGIWYWYDLPALRRAIGLDLPPVVVEADAAPNPGGLPVGGRTVTTLPNRHLQYAVTWYGLALTLIGVYIAFRRRLHKDDG
jgi:surfeit locus 1 family protein